MKTFFAIVFAVASLASGSAAQARDSGYEVWASDQSNSIAGVSAVGVKGSYLWIWDSKDIEAQLSGGPDASPLACARFNGGNSKKNIGPCDLLEVFPRALQQIAATGQAPGLTPGVPSGFGRLHAMIAHPPNRYVNPNIFAPNGVYFGVIDTLSP